MVSERLIDTGARNDTITNDARSPLLVIDGGGSRLSPRRKLDRISDRDKRLRPYRYQAQHGFGNETGERHDPEATKLAWQRTLDFLAKHIK